MPYDINAMRAALGERNRYGVRTIQTSTPRTLLASLGFADPDHSDSIHDLACQYLGQPEQMAALDDIMPWAKRFEQERKQLQSERDDVPPISYTATYEYLLANEWLERPTKPYGRAIPRRGNTIGFLDLIIVKKYPIPGSCYDDVTNKRGSCWDDQTHSIVVEVKTHPLSIGDLLRQLKLYQNYHHANAWVVATTYKINELDKSALDNEDIRHVYLGQKFQAWAASVQNREATSIIEL
jgi:hypothetical protein